MKKKVLIGTISAAIILGGAFAVGAANNDDGNPSKTIANVKNEKSKISAEEAEKIALQEVNGVVESIELEVEHGREVYDVDVDHADGEYEIDINAFTGEIYSVELDDSKEDDKYDDDKDDDSNDDNQKTLSNSNQSNVNTNFISQDDAVAIAEKEVNGKMFEIKKDEDDGLVLYEVELQTDKGKAEVDIEASTGKVLKVEWDN